MTPDIARSLAELGERGRACLAQRTQADSPQRREFRARLQAMPPAEAAAELRAPFALDPSTDLADAIAGDLGLDPEKAGLIAAEIAAARQRIAHATRAFRSRGEPADNEAA